MAELAGEWMANNKVKFIRKCVPTKVELIDEGPPRKLKVEYKNTETGEVLTEEFNTVRKTILGVTYYYIISNGYNMVVHINFIRTGLSVNL